jgi:hypothetical protein
MVSPKKNQNMFQIFVLDQKFQKNIVTFLKLFVNTMILKIKIWNILDIIKVSKSIQPNKYIRKKSNRKLYLDGFSKMKVRHS